MADDLENRGAQDRALISLKEAHEVRYWTQVLGVNEEQLREVVSRVGHGVAAVREELKKTS